MVELEIRKRIGTFQAMELMKTVWLRRRVQEYWRDFSVGPPFTTGEHLNNNNNNNLVYLSVDAAIKFIYGRIEKNEESKILQINYLYIWVSVWGNKFKYCIMIIVVDKNWRLILINNNGWFIY